MRLPLITFLSLLMFLLPVKAAPEAASLLIKNATIVTMDADKQIVRQGSLAICRQHDRGHWRG